MLQQFGIPPQNILDSLTRAEQRPGVLYAAVMDEPALWDPSTLEGIIEVFPRDLLPEADLFLILSECFANAALHGRAQALGLCVRKRGPVLMMSFQQNPPMIGRVAIALSIARTAIMDKKSCDLESGLGFPILFRLAYNVSISLDYTRLQLWFHV